MTALAESLLSAFRDAIAAVEDDRLAAFMDGLNWSMPERPLEPNALPCQRHLPDLADDAARFGRPLAQLLADHGDAFRWGQTYGAADFGERFLREYGWLEVFGTRGHFACRSMAGGLLVLGPDVDYPDHHHLAEEIYVPLTSGTVWRMDGRPYADRRGGDVIHHPSNVSHAMRTGNRPLLALYLWRGGPLDQRSVIDGATG